AVSVNLGLDALSAVVPKVEVRHYSLRLLVKCFDCKRPVHLFKRRQWLRTDLSTSIFFVSFFGDLGRRQTVLVFMSRRDLQRTIDSHPCHVLCRTSLLDDRQSGQVSSANMGAFLLELHSMR
ncbi:unnamed protein product, partial [Ectocarpus sp. 12 AP-2014]